MKQGVACFPKIRCVHLQFPGPEVLQATLNKYREKSLLIKLVDIAQDFDASLESLEKTLFYSEKGSVRLIWEYTIMSFQDTTEEILEAYKEFHDKLVELNVFYNKNGALSVSEIKSTIKFFRIAIEHDVKPGPRKTT